MFKAVLAIVQVFLLSLSAQAVDLDAFIAKLEGPGAVIEVHGMDVELGRYVGTYREDNFFNYIHFALTSEDASILRQFESLRRHDRLRIKGSIPSLQRSFLHVEIVELEVLDRHDGPIDDHEHGVKLPDELIHSNTAVLKLHATSPSGRMLVADFKGAILPIRVPEVLSAKTQSLGRGDIIRIRYELSDAPIQPIHLTLLEEESALEVLDALVDTHGQTVEYEGSLVLFPQSPQLRFPVFALQVASGIEGIQREYTIVNFEDIDLFLQLREYLESVWNQSDITPINDRNKLVKPGLRFRIKAKMNYVSPSQANPQLLVEAMDDVVLLP